MSENVRGLTQSEIDALLENGDYARLEEQLAVSGRVSERTVVSTPEVPLTPEEIIHFAEEAPSAREIDRLGPLGRTFVSNEGQVGVLDAIALRGRELVGGGPDITVLSSRNGRILVLRPETNEGQQYVRYESASLRGGRTVSFGGGDIVSKISENPGQIGAIILYDSETGPEASVFRKALLRSTANGITNPLTLDSEPANERRVSPRGVAGPISSFRDPNFPPSQQPEQPSQIPHPLVTTALMERVPLQPVKRVS